MRKDHLSQDPELLDMARKEALRSLFRLTVQEGDPEVYHNAVSISSGARDGEFGEIANIDVDGLLGPYIDRGLVTRARVRYHTTGRGRFTTGYRANLDMTDGIEGELRRPPERP